MSKIMAAAANLYTSFTLPYDLVHGFQRETLNSIILDTKSRCHDPYITHVIKTIPVQLIAVFLFKIFKQHLPVKLCVGIFIVL